MPGIVGLITAMPRQQAERELLQMVESLRHETFYVSGMWADEELGVYAGWIAQRGSFSDQMPLRNERGDVTLVFSGEEFAEPGTSRHLKEQGHALDADGPSYLVHLYEEDAAFLVRLNGRFQGILMDKARGTTTLFNDRYGMHRIYYHQSKEAFYFAAEAKAILSVRPELRKADPRGIGEFIACGCVLENRTLFEGIQVLPPGSAWVFRSGALKRIGVYFEAKEWEEQSPLDPQAYYQKLREVFSQNLPRYFNGSQQVAMSLTGGLDTRMILAWHKPSPGSLPCYSFGGMFRDSQDVLLARRVASVRNQSHWVIPVGGDFLSHFPRYAERTVYLTDGCVDISHSPDLYVNERAREIAPVRITGNYGGEVLRRVRAFKPVPPVAGLFRPEFLTQIQAAGNTYAAQVRTHPLSFAVFRQTPWHHYGLLALEQSQLSLRSPYLDNSFVQTVFRAPESACMNNDVCLRLIAEGDASLLQIRTDRGYAGNQGRLATKISRGLLEFAAKAEYAYDYGMPQWMAQIDHQLSPFHLERLFLGRHKFYHFRVWYRDALSKYVQEMLLDAQTLSRPYLERRALERIVGGHLKGDRNYTTSIHKVLTLELVHRLLLDPR
jgi:asparagine synthase (glutamine-hydrolysing)